MSNLLQLQGGMKSYGTKVLFSDAQFAVNEDEHVGVIGPNGAGKTTLFKILTDQEALDDGILTRSKSLRIGYLSQHDHWSADQTVEDYLAEAHQTPLWELKSLGSDLGISEDLYSRPIASLSGGYRMRCKLLYLIGQQPNLMLLDEPTNYLDLETTLVLEGFLRDYKGAFLLISHDREFLRRTTDHILEVEQGQITKYNGNIDDYFEQKELLRSQLEGRALSLQEKKDEILKFVARFGAKATKAKQAQSRLKSLDRMETIELKPLPVSASIKIPEPIRTGKVILTVREASLGYGEKTVLRKIEYLLLNGDHVAIVGLNGAGKTTFLKALAKAIQPMKGSVELGFNVTLGYYAQHVAEGLDESSTVLDQMLAKAHPDVTTQDGLNMAGSMLFSGNDVKKKISVLSGGEKSRVALGQILLQRAPLLVLDEPTNHLDFQTVEAMTQALVNFRGTVVIVSHDRSFVRRIGTKIVEISNGRVTVYPGTYEEYIWSLQHGVLAQNKLGHFQLEEEESPAPQAAIVPTASTTSSANFREMKKNIQRELKQNEKVLLEHDKKLAILNKMLQELNQTVMNAQGPQQKEKILELGQVQKKLDDVESLWLVASEKKEQLEKALKDLANRD